MVLVLIPARYQSSRFPGKPLAKIQGKSMVSHIVANFSDFAGEVAFVTDHSEIQQEIEKHGGTAIRVDDDVPSGTDRIHLAFERNYSDQDFELIVNVQGDEPLLKSDEVQKLIDFHLNSKFDITTLVKRRKRSDRFDDPNCVKAVYDPESGRCQYFSRAGVPFDRENIDAPWYHHIGIYSYRPKALISLASAEQGRLEKLECLEQLRAFDLGLTIGAIETEMELMGIDHPSDIELLEEHLREKKDQ